MSQSNVDNPTVPGSPGPTPAANRGRFDWAKKYVPLVAALFVLFVGGILVAPDSFLTIGNQRNVLEQVSINGILAVGMTMVILTAGIDLSVGSVLSLCSVVCAMLLMHGSSSLPGDELTRAHWLVLPAIGLAMAIAAYAVLGRWFAGTVRIAGALVAFGAGAGISAVLVHPTWLPWAEPGLSTIGVLVIVPLVGGMMGMISGTIIAKTKLQPFIVTLAMMIAAVGLAKFIAGHGGQVHSIYIEQADQPGAPQSFADLGEPILTVAEKKLRSGKTYPVKLIPIPGLFLLGCWAVVAMLLHKYPLGRYIYAVGGNEETARLAGVAVDRVKIFVYTASGFLAGLAGVLFCAKYQQGLATAGQMKELDAIAAVVIGGTSLMGGRGSILGTLVGIMIFGYLTNILNLKGVSSEIQDIVKGVIIIGAAVLQSGGFIARMQFRRRPKVAVK